MSLAYPTSSFQNRNDVLSFQGSRHPKDIVTVFIEQVSPGPPDEKSAHHRDVPLIDGPE